jgi:hypothetical protein
MSNCADVCLDMNHGLYNDVYSERVVVARKKHCCCECGEIINPGQSYETVRGLCEGTWFSAKTCADCLAIRNAVVCGEWLFGELWEALVEEVFPAWLEKSPIDCLAKIALKSARDKLAHRFEEWRKDVDCGGRG